ncbi:hypothetical protein RvY_01732 [Ramazzottius varieornatus]|uniref:AAA+ ATPase domain-containing protein n=1 Tax=Ramazzottius varieornatus TaxID=947166 RepID=A0A1D1USI4_RAMVA|nr:hypothetical protein RvY_01732 [Ramazzottius varieornatus]
MSGGHSHDLHLDLFDEDRSDLSFLQSKPGCFAVFGPPGSGKSIVARIIAHYWKCLLVTRYILDDFPTPELNVLSLEEQFDLLRSLDLKVDFVIVVRFPLEDAVRRKEKLYLHAPTGIRIAESYIAEAAHYEDTTESGLVEDTLRDARAAPAPAPSVVVEGDEEGEGAEKTEGKAEEPTDDEAEGEASKDTKPATKKSNKRDKEREAIKAEHAKALSGNSGQPAVVLDERQTTTLRNGSRTTFGHVRRRLAEPIDEAKARLEAPILLPETPEEDKEDGEEEEGEENPAVVQKPVEVEADTDVAFFRNLFFPNIPIVDNKMQFPNESLHLCVENSAEWVQDDYLDYKKTSLVHIEVSLFLQELILPTLNRKNQFHFALQNFMAAYYPLRVIEIDGHTPLRQIPQLVMSRLECMRLQPPPIPHPLTDMIALQKIPEETAEVDKQLEQALLVGAPSPRWKWRKSIFGTLCPVSLAEGLTVPGKIFFATVFLDRLYLLADKVQQEKFIQNPRLYILPPNPKTPTRFVVMGPSGSARSTMAKKLAETFGSRIVDLQEVFNQVKREQTEELTLSTRARAIPQAMAMVRASLTEKLTPAKSELEAAGAELRALKSDSPFFDILRDVLEPVRKASEPPLNPTVAMPTVRFAEDVKNSGEPDSPAGSYGQEAAPTRKPTREESLPSINIPLPPIPQNRLRTSLAGAPLALENIPAEVAAVVAPEGGGEGLETIPEEAAPEEPVLIIEEVAPPAVSAEPEVPPKVYTEEELARIDELETKLPELRIIYLALKTEVEELKETTPAVVAEVDRVLSLVNFDAIRFDNARFVVLMKDTLAAAFSGGAETRNGRIDSAQYVLDNVLASEEIGAALLAFEEKWRPTDFVFMKDSSEKMDALHTNFHRTEILRETTSFALSDEAWDLQIASISRQLAEIDKVHAAVSGATLRVHTVNLSEKTLEDVMVEIGSAALGEYKPTVQDYVEPEGAEEESDQEDEEHEDGTMFTKPKKVDENSEKTKPLGDTGDYCPVALKETNGLRLGNPEHGLVTYKDKIYSFSSTEAKEKFRKDPETYLPKERPAEPPPLRIFVTGPTGSGRTTHAKIMAEQCDAYLINLKTFMNEVALPKLQNPPVETFTLDRPPPYWRLPKEPSPASENLLVTEKKLPEGLLPVKLPFLPVLSLRLRTLQVFLERFGGLSPLMLIIVFLEVDPIKPDEPPALTPLEQACQDALTSESALPTEVLTELFDKWTKRAPYAGRNLVFDGFPQYAEDARFLIEKGIFPDAIFITSLEEDTVVDRILPKRKAHWLQEKKKRGEKRFQAFFVKHKEWVKSRSKKKKELLRDRADAKREKEQEAAQRRAEAKAAGNEEPPDEEEEDDEEEALETMEAQLDEEYPEPKLEDEQGEEGSEDEETANDRLNDELRDRLDKDQGNIDGIKEVFEEQKIKIYDINALRPEKISLRKWQAQLGPLLKKRESLFQLAHPVSGIMAKEMLDRHYKRLGKFGTWCPVKRLAEEIGIQRISIGDAIRHVLIKLADAELCRLLKTYLASGCDIPDALEILCLEALLRTADCQTRGWILDGYPSTFGKLNVMMQRLIVPTLVFELVASNKTCMLRSVIEIMLSKKQKLPPLNNSQVVATRLAHYKTNIPPVQNYLKKYTKNLHQIDTTASKWKMWFTALEIIAQRTVDIQGYVDKREKQTAAPLTGLCVTPNQLKTRLSTAYGVYCPVTFNTQYQLFDCLARANGEFIAEYREKYYLFASKEKMEAFLDSPDRWLPPIAYRTMPPRDQLPKVVQVEELDDQWAEKLAFAGMCVVTYVDHDTKPSGLKYGQANFVVKYNEKLWQFCSVECMNKFLSQPWNFVNTPLPSKRPPQPEHPVELEGPVSVVPYLETSLGPVLVQAIMEAAELRPKYPHIGYKDSAMVFIGNYLKRANPEASAECREISTEKLRGYGELSSLAEQLMLNAQGLKDSPLADHIQHLLEQTEKLIGVKNNVQKDWHALCPF